MSFVFPRSILRDGEAGASGGGGTAAASAAGSAASSGTASAAAGATGGSGASAAATAPEPFWKGLYSDDGKLNKANLDRLPDDLKPAKDWIAKYDNIGALLFGGHNANIVASKKALAPLEANAPDHVKAERKALLDGVNNVPKEAKGYGIARPQDFPEQFWNQAGADELAGVAHKHSLSPEAVKDLVALQIKLTNAELANGKKMEGEFFAAQDTEFAALAQRNGLALDKALDLAARGFTTLGGDPKSDLFKNAAVRGFALKFAQMVAEDKLVDGKAAGMGKSDYRGQYLDIMNNPQNPLNAGWNDGSHPLNQRAKDAVHKLMRQHGQQTRGEKVEG